jgi:hypothetical protein
LMSQVSGTEHDESITGIAIRNPRYIYPP